MQATLKLLDIARYKRKALKKEKEKQKREKKSNNNNKCFFTSFVRKHILKNNFCVVVIGNRAIKHQCWNRYALVL